MRILTALIAALGVASFAPQAYALVTIANGIYEVQVQESADGFGAGEN